MKPILKGLQTFRRRWLFSLAALLAAVALREFIGAFLMTALLWLLILAALLVLPALLGALAGRITGEAAFRLRRSPLRIR